MRALLVSEATLERARARVRAGREVHRAAWERTLAVAEAALERDDPPYQGPEYLRYFETALYTGPGRGPHVVDYAAGGGQAHAARHLAVAYRIGDDERHLEGARRLLLAWARAQAANRATGGHPASEQPHGAGLVIGRVCTVFADAYCLVAGELDAGERDEIEAWLRDMAGPIVESRRIWQEGTFAHFKPPWLGGQAFNNHLGAQTMGLTAIAYATGDAALAEHALRDPANPRSLAALIDGVILMPGDELYHDDPTLTRDAPPAERGEVYDRYRSVHGEGLHYAHLHLRCLTLMAEMARSNTDATDWYAHRGAGGRSLRDAFAFYSAIVADGSGARTGYYAGEEVDPGFAGLYELAAERYPDDPEIAAVPGRAGKRVTEDVQTFGWTAPLIWGPPTPPSASEERASP